MKKGDILYYARCIPNMDIYEILTVKVRGIYDGYFVTIDSSGLKQARLFNDNEIERTVFKERRDAVIYSEEQEELNRNNKKYSNETYYEEF